MQTSSNNYMCVSASVWSDPQVYLLLAENKKTDHRALLCLFLTPEMFTDVLRTQQTRIICNCCSFNVFLFWCASVVTSPHPTSPHTHPPPPVLPIQTSPNWPLPSFLISWRDSRGISHISLVFTDKSASLGMPRLQLPIKRQHSPAALSESERERQTGRQKKKKIGGKENSRCRDKGRTRQVAYALMQLTS